mmetsp:Transcript_60387/g.69993  ORF Transcript_60387/g.69993 Transcript_60387/m.69993 type:complete len:186 (-) Transcript_60387:134-691(-)
MDGHFVPNLTMGPPIIQSLRKHTKAFLDCHCMVTDPAKWVEPLAKAGADQITFHYESNVENHEELAKKIRDSGMKVGLTIKPKTELNQHIFDLIDKGLIDNFLVMTVEPGFGGQKFMEDMMPKVKELRKRYPSLNIQVDGGITTDNINISAEAGANVIVSGSGIFGHPDPAEAIKIMRDVVTKNL